jgi:AraC-like DNA-binding protein
MPPASSPIPPGQSTGDLPPVTAPLLKSYRRKTSDDINDLHDAVEPYAVGHNLERVKEGDALRGVVNALTVGDVSLVWVSYGGQGVVVETPPTDGEFAMCAPVAPMSVEYRTSKAHDTATGTLVLSHDEPMRMKPHPDEGCLVIATSTGRLSSHLSSYLGPEPLPLLRFHTGPGPSIQPVSTVEHTWRHVCAILDQAAPAGLHPLVARSLEDSLLTTLLLALPNTATPLLARTPDSDHLPGYLAPLIRDWLHSNFRQPIGVADIAAAAGISIRQLQITCRRTWGQTPTQLLRGLRLDHARSRLETSQPGQVTIPAVAIDAGYLNVSRFGAHYRQRFGETPTQTLRRASSTHRTG